MSSSNGKTNPLKNWAQELAHGTTTPEAMKDRGWLNGAAPETLARMKDNFDFRVPRSFEEGVERGDRTLALQVVPNPVELEFKPEELEDPIGDERWTPVEGITHRYPDRVLLKPTYNCAVYCRFCFRRYKVSDSSFNLSREKLQLALDYIRKTESIREVILTGGDPLTLTDRRLAEILDPIREIGHVDVVRFHTRIPSVLPSRVTPALVEQLRGCGKVVWIVAHINSATELTDEATAAIRALVDGGIPMLSQSVLLKGVNDDAVKLEALVRGLIHNRIKPYYLHYPDLAQGTNHFRIPLAQAIELVKSLRGKVPGYALPALIVDIPGGEGKVQVDAAQWAEQIGKDTWEFVSPLSGSRIRITYPAS